MDRNNLNIHEKLRHIQINWPDYYAVMPVSVLDLSVRATNILHHLGIYKIKDTISLSSDTLLNAKNCGRKTIDEIISKLLQFIVSNELESLRIHPNDKQHFAPDYCWYNSIKQNPEIRIIFDKYAVNSETDFLILREESSETDILSLDYKRFHYYKSILEQANLEQLLFIVPNWVLNTNVEFIKFRTRVRNTFLEKGVSSIKDLCLFNIREMLEWPNFGIHSLNNIVQAVIEFASQEQTFPTSYLTEERIKERITEIPLLQHIEYSLNELCEKETLILKLRLGYEQSKLTLEEVGAKLGLTRERIRQIEKNAYKKLMNYNYWDDILLDKLDRLLSAKRNIPLYVSMLEIEDCWFKGCSEKQEFISELIFHISEKRLKILNFGEPIISRIPQDLLFQILNELLDDIEQLSSQNITRDDLNMVIEDKLNKYDCLDLRDIMTVQIEDKLQFRYDSDLSEEYLVGVGNGFKLKLLSLLQESPIPLHYIEITQLFNKKYDSKNSERTIHSKFNLYSDFKLFARGTYGLLSHLDIADEQQKFIIWQCEKLIEESNVNKQWSCHEILTRLSGEIYTNKFHLDKYRLDIILSKSSKLRSMGRQIWVHCDSEKIFKQSRIEIESTCIQVLLNAGVPLSSDILINEVEKIRGVGEFLILQPNNNYTRVAPNLWGLVERDFYIRENEKGQILNSLWSILREFGCCLYIDELKEFLDIESNADFNNFTNYMLYSLATLDNRFRAFRGYFIGLSDWDNNTRFNFSLAVKKVISDMKIPMLTSEIQEKVEALTMRKVDKNRVSTALSANVHVLYDKKTNLWLKV